MAMLRICLFGQIRVAHDDPAREARVTPTTQKLLAFLLLRPHRCLPRDVLVDLSWGDRPENQARGALNTALFRLRRVLEPDGVQCGTYLVTMPNGEVGFNWDSRHWLDLTVFEQTAERILAVPVEQLSAGQALELADVLPLYVGDLLEGLYDDWALRERERLRLIHLNCLYRLMQYHRRHEAYADSVRYGELILRQDPLREEVHRELICLHLAYGQRAQALRQYEQCRAVLLSELNIAPMPETQAVYAEIMAGSPDPLPPDDTVELGQALDQLGRALDAFDGATHDLRRALRLLKAATARPPTTPGPRRGNLHSPRDVRPM